MVKTTVYLPEELKRRLERVAATRGESEAELIRSAVARLVDEEEAPEPRLPLFSTGDGTLSQRVDEILAEGFGRD